MFSLYFVTNFQGWDLILNLGNAAKNVIDASGVKVHAFLGDILGKNWTAIAPPSWQSDCA
jgi:hypothetical protein